MSTPTPTAARGNYYHIVLRGYRRNVLFSTPEDRRALNHFAIKAMRRFSATLHAYCLLPGQFRFLVQMEDRALIDAVREIVSRYSRHRGRASDVAAQLFERPYIAQRVEGDEEFLAVLRSIHLNPVIANEVVDPDDYRWSSHRAYVGFKSVASITTEHGLSLLDPDRARSRSEYQRFIAEGLAAEVERLARAKLGEQKEATEHEEAIELIGADLCRTTIRPLLELPTAPSSDPSRGDAVPAIDRPRRFLSIY